MIIRAYRPEEDQEDMRFWLLARDLDPKLADELPEIGFVAHGSGEPIAMGFLRKIEDQDMLIDSVITNPQASPQNRHRALDLITQRLILKAMEMRKRKVIAFSEDLHTIERALKHGYQKAESMSVLILPLQEKEENSKR